jgi:hypothetical protein
MELATNIDGGVNTLCGTAQNDDGGSHERNYFLKKSQGKALFGLNWGAVPVKAPVGSNRKSAYIVPRYARCVTWGLFIHFPR